MSVEFKNANDTADDMILEMSAEIEIWKRSTFIFRNILIKQRCG